jgi:hypothetical protein
MFSIFSEFNELRCFGLGCRCVSSSEHVLVFVMFFSVSENTKIYRSLRAPKTAKKEICFGLMEEIRVI